MKNLLFSALLSLILLFSTHPISADLLESAPAELLNSDPA